MSTKPPPMLDEALAAFDDDALVRMMLAQFAEGFPDFASGGERMRATAERAREIIREAWDTRRALAALEAGHAQLHADRRSLVAALEGIRPFVAEDFPEKEGEIDWNAYPVSFGYAKAYRALLVALGRIAP